MWLFQLCVFLCLARYGFSQDVYLTCPEAWVQNTTTRLTCDVEISRWAQPNPCATLSRTVDFIFQPVGLSGSPACTVLNVDTSCSSGTANAQGCGCTKTSTHYNLFYDVVANKATHENGSWSCQPDCLTSAIPPTNPLTRQTSNGCTKTVFPQPCDNNPCKPGSCSVVNNARQCNCSSSYYKGPLCQDDPCNGTSNCLVMRRSGNFPERRPAFGYLEEFSHFVKCGLVIEKDNCRQVSFGVIVIGAPQFFIIVILVICFVVIEVFLSWIFPNAKKKCCLVTFVVLFNFCEYCKCCCKCCKVCQGCKCCECCECCKCCEYTFPEREIYEKLLISGTEPKPDYDTSATNRGFTVHTATGSKKNGQGVTPL